jgi:drug/metabolite transporter (DMT)-like permease
MNSVWSFVAPSQKVTNYSPELYLWTVGLAFVCLVFQSAFTKSMQYNTVGAVQVICYLLIPFGYFLDSLVVGQQFHTLELVGAGIICITNVGITTSRLKGIID